MRHEEVLYRAAPSTQPRFDFTGAWENELSSTMNIVDEEGVLIGVFSSAAGDDGTTLSGQLSGNAQGDLIAFTVKWPTSAVTAWVGRLRRDADKDVIDTLWQMTALSDDGRTGVWHSLYAGADRFTRPLDKATAGRPDELRVFDAVDTDTVLDD